ncbi:MAG: hypothetical protein V2A67_07380 [Bacteroidota bacterium]
MKRFCRLIVSGCLSFLIISMFSCSEEIDLYPDNYEGQLFVWACLDGTGGVQQVKIRKAIMGEANVFDLLDDPASYLPDDSLKVYLVQEGGMPIYLEPVVYPPQTGAFAEDSNVIYETPHYYPWPGEKHKLVITNLETGLITSSEIITVTKPSFSYPVIGSAQDKFFFTLSNRPFHISWKGNKVSLWSISLKYLDILQTGDTLFRKATYTGALTLGYPENNGEFHYSREFPLAYLWRIFNMLIQEDPDVHYRMFYRFDFCIWGGDKNLGNYLETAQRFDDNRKQYFSNITNGAGLFYSMNHTLLKNVCPKDDFATVLHRSDSVKHLKFSNFIFYGYYIDPDSVGSNPLIPVDL